MDDYSQSLYAHIVHRLGEWLEYQVCINSFGFKKKSSSSITIALLRHFIAGFFCVSLGEPCIEMYNKVFLGRHS